MKYMMFVAFCVYLILGPVQELLTKEAKSTAVCHEFLDEHLNDPTYKDQYPNSFKEQVEDQCEGARKGLIKGGVNAE